MPLGFSIIGSTVTFDLILRWATQGPLGPLVFIHNTRYLFSGYWHFVWLAVIHQEEVVEKGADTLGAESGGADVKLAPADTPGTAIPLLQLLQQLLRYETTLILL